MSDISCSNFAQSIDQYIDCQFSLVANIIEPVVFYAPMVSFGGTQIAIPLIIVWMALGSLLFSVYFNFINFRFFKHAIHVVCGKYDNKQDAGEITSFQALTASLSGTVGLGNIAGVAIAISLGGPGAVFWMVLMGLLGMSSKFLEVALGVKYRQKSKENQEIFGGPMYYIKPAFDKIDGVFCGIKTSSLGRAMAIFFAVACIGGAIGGGNLFQANQAYQQAVAVTGGNESFLQSYGWAFGLFLAVLTGVVTLGGVRIIGSVTAKLIPFMALIYVGAGLLVIVMNVTAVPDALKMIVTQAFSAEAGVGALIGAILQGVKRASFSNEAGLGSAAIIYAATRTKSHIQQGFASMLGPFIDTVIICLVTALVIVLSGVYEDSQGIAGVEMTSKAFGEDIVVFPYILAVSVFLFAYSTLITWSYYAEKAVVYLFGERKIFVTLFRVTFLGFVVVGCTLELSNVVRASEALLFIMAIPNLIAMYLLAPEIKKDLGTYISKLKG